MPKIKICYGSLPTKNELIKLLENNTLGYIKEKFGITRATLNNLLVDYNINPREYTKFRCPTKERLMAMLQESDGSVLRMSKKYGVSRTAIYGWKVKYQI